MLIKLQKIVLDLNETGSEWLKEEITEMNVNSFSILSFMFMKEYSLLPAFATHLLREVTNLYEVIPFSVDTVSSLIVHF